MSVLYLALPVALMMGAAAMLACVRCIRAGQYDDMETPPLRILTEDRVVTRRQPSRLKHRKS